MDRFAFQPRVTSIPVNTQSDMNMKTGDAIAAIATPIARALHLPCIDPETQQLRPESGCAQRRRLLNEGRYADAFFNFFWSNNNKEESNMQFTITIAVEAESVEEALQKKAEGKTISIMPRPQPAPQPTRLTPGLQSKPA